MSNRGDGFPRVVHVSHHPVGAKAFLEPVVSDLNRRGTEAELWVEAGPATRAFCNELHVPWREAPCQITGSPRRNIAALRAMMRLIRATRPAVLHCHQTRASLWPLVAGRMLRVPVLVYHNHGLSYPAFDGTRRIALRQLQRCLCRLAHQTWFVSPSTLSMAREDGVLDAGAGLVPGPGSIAGIDLREFDLAEFGIGPRVESRRRLGLAAGGCVFGFVGRPMASKGFPQLVGAWQAGRLWNEGGQLICAGCTPDDLAARGATAEQGAHGLGYLKDMKPFYQACDVVVLPSRSEGFPYSMLEAAAAGRATLGTRVPGMVDAIWPGRTGYLVKPDDPEELVAGLRRLAGDPGERERLGEAGRDWVRERFAREVVLEALWKHYRRDLLPRPPSGATMEAR